MDRQNKTPNKNTSRHSQALRGRESSLQRYRAASRGDANPVSVIDQKMASPSPSVAVEAPSLQLTDLLQTATTESVQDDMQQAQPAFTPMTASYQTSIDGIKQRSVDWTPVTTDPAEDKRVSLDTMGYLSEQFVPSVPEVESPVDAEVIIQQPKSFEDQLLEEVVSEKNSQPQQKLADLYQIKPDEDSPKKLSQVRTLTVSALACGMMAVGIFTFFARVDSAPIVAQPVGPAVVEVEVPVNNSTQGDAGDQSMVAVDPAHPVRIVIGEVGVNAPVIGLGLTNEGLIDVPDAFGVVGWYNKGVLPGNQGPAVIVGHFTEGNGGAFDRLYQVKEGDLITVTNGKGENFTYKMTAKKEYDTAKVPMQKIFASSDNARLEIITCAGKWQANDYNKRLVVTAELVR